MIAWRPMRAEDLPAVLAIADVVHPGFPERPEVLDEKRALYPKGAWIAEGDAGPVGYALAHAGVIGAPPALDGLMGALPVKADCLYIHDVALLPPARGQGLAASIIGLLDREARAAGWTTLALTAVNGSAPLWRRLGFAAVSAEGALAAKLTSYGPEACYMLRPAGQSSSGVAA